MTMPQKKQAELDEALVKAADNISSAVTHDQAGNQQDHNQPYYTQILDLLAQGADINTTLYHTRPPLLSYLVQLKTDITFITKVLTYNPNLHQEDKYGITPLIDALTTEPERQCYINAFLAHDPHCLFHEDDEGNNILHKMSAYKGFDNNIADATLQNIKTFILEPHPELMSRNYHLEFPLHVAAQNANNKLLSLFLEQDGPCVACRNETGDDAIIIAARKCNWAGVDIMLDKYPHMVGTIDDQGNNLLHVIANTLSSELPQKIPLALIRTRLGHLTLEPNLEGLRPVAFTKPGPGSDLRRIFLDVEATARCQKGEAASGLSHPSCRPA